MPIPEVATSIPHAPSQAVDILWYLTTLGLGGIVFLVWRMLIKMEKTIDVMRDNQSACKLLVETGITRLNSDIEKACREVKEIKSERRRMWEEYFFRHQHNPQGKVEINR